MKDYIYYGIGLKDCILYISSKKSDLTPKIFIKNEDNKYPWVGLHLNSIEVVNTVNTITNAYKLFAGCDCRRIDLRGFDSSKITNMSYMFSDCNNLTYIDVSDFDTSNVTNMSSMFNNCSNLEHLDISNFNITQVTDLHYMFKNCAKLQYLNTGEFRTVVDNVCKYGMFYGCGNARNMALHI